MRENAWLNHAPPVLPIRPIDKRYESPSHNFYPPLIECYSDEYRSAQNCNDRNWQNRKGRHGNDNWERREKFKYVSSGLPNHHRNKDSPNLHCHTDHSRGMPLQENLPRAYGLYSELPSRKLLPPYQSKGPLVDQKFINANQFNNTCILKGQEQLSDLVQPTSEVGNPTPKLDVVALFKKLVETGIIPEDKSKPPEIISEEKKIPKLDFCNMKTFKRRYNAVINALHRGTQCSSCGLRFADKDKYSQHLDWHFKVNRRKKQKVLSRAYYLDVKDWIYFEGTESVEPVKSFFEKQAEEQNKVSQKIELPSVTASINESLNICAVCEEHLDQFWSQEKEEWCLNNAIRIDNQVFHPGCYGDFEKANEAPETPVDVPDDPFSVPSTIKKEENKDDDETDKKVKQTLIESGSIKVEDMVKGEVQRNVVPQENTEVSANEIKTEESVKVKEEPVEVKEEPIEVKEQHKAVEETEATSTSELYAMIENTSIKEEARPESKMVILKSGGIVVKVRADSIAMPTSVPKVTPPQNADADDIEEMEYPSPDPRFQVLPPVQRGTELSGLCSIM